MKTKSKVVLTAAIVLAAGILLVFLNRRGGKEKGGLRAGFDSEFLVRPDGYPGLKKAYGFDFPQEPRHMDPGLMYKAVAGGTVDVICGFATDGRIPAYGLVALEDDKHFFPPYYAAPLVRADTLKKHPELKGILNRLAGKLSDETMRKLNYEVDEGNRKAADVALEFLLSEGLIPSAPAEEEHAAGTVTIGGKNFTEQEILGELLALLIESHSRITVERKLNLGGTMICFNALEAGDLGLYPEYTGTGLVSILKREAIADPAKAYETVKQAFAEKYDMVWLKPFGFNNTYTLTMRREQAEKLGIRSISGLVSHLGAE